MYVYADANSNAFRAIKQTINRHTIMRVCAYPRFAFHFVVGGVFRRRPPPSHPASRPPPTERAGTYACFHLTDAAGDSTFRRAGACDPLVMHYHVSELRAEAATFL